MATSLGSVTLTPLPAAAMGSNPVVYVTNDNNDVVPVDTSTNTPGAPIAVGTHPIGIAITPDGATAYVANAVDNTVTWDGVNQAAAEGVRELIRLVGQIPARSDPEASAWW